jgi:hypothetical protein
MMANQTTDDALALTTLITAAMSIAQDIQTVAIGCSILFLRKKLSKNAFFDLNLISDVFVIPQNLCLWRHYGDRARGQQVRFGTRLCFRVTA